MNNLIGPQGLKICLKFAAGQFESSRENGMGMLKIFFWSLCIGVSLGAHGQVSSITPSSMGQANPTQLAPGIDAGMLGQDFDPAHATSYATTSFCLPVATPLVMNFPGAAGNALNPAVPPCWSLHKTDGQGYVEASSSSKSLPNRWRFQNGPNLDSIFLVSPSIIGLDSNSKQVRFWITTGSIWSGNNITIGTVPNQSSAPTTFNAIQTVSVSAGSTWKEVVVPIHSSFGYNVADQHIAFLCSNPTSVTPVLLDDISIENIPTCNLPFNIQIDTVTTDSVLISWQSIYGQSFIIEIGPGGFTPGTGTFFNTNSNQHIITGLSANNGYQFYISDSCNPAQKVGPFNFFTPCRQIAAGTYTIGGPIGSVDFASMEEATSALQCGITGPVVFNLNAGSYPGYYRLIQIPGASDTNTVTFNGAGSGLTIFTGNSSLKPTFEFHGTKYVTFQNMTIQGGNGESAIWINSNASFLQFENLDVFGDTSSTGVGVTLISTGYTQNNSLAYGSGVNNLTFKNLLMKGGSYSITLIGKSTTSFSKNFFLENITITKAYHGGIICRAIKGITVNRSKATDFRGATGNGINALYLKDWIFTNNFFESGNSGIRIEEGNFSTQPSDYSIISNNISKSNTIGTYLINTKYVNINHNTLYGANSSLYLVGCSFFKVKNNILSTTSGENLGAHNVVFSATSHIDYNLFDKGTGKIANVNSTSYYSLPALVAAIPSINQHSVAGPAGFVSPTDFHIQLNSLAFNSGDTSVHVPFDFDGHPRPDTGSFLVDMGADEYLPRSWDLEFQGLALSSEKCGDSATAIGVIVKNLGLNTISSPTLSTQLTGGLNQTLQASPNLNIPFLGIDTVFIGTVNTSLGASNVLLNGSIQLTSDEDTTNNSGFAGPFRFVPQVPALAFNDTLCSGQDSATIAALPINGVEYGWFANATDLAPVATGNSFSFPTSGQNTWYVNYLYVMDSLSTVPYSTSLGCSAGIMFDIAAQNDISIFGMDINSRKTAGTQGTATVHIIPNGQSAASGNDPMAWMIHEVVTFTSNGNGLPSSFAFQNPIQIPAGATYAFYVQYDAGYSDGNLEPTVFKNQDFTLTSVSGHCNPFSPITPRVFNGTIRYGTKACSEPKQAVTVFVDKDTAQADILWNIISLGTVAFSDGGSSFGTSYTWDFGDGSPLISTSTPSTSHTYFVTGLYTITVIANTSCSADTTVFQIPINSVGIHEGAGIRDLSLYPNPTAGGMTVAFSSLTDGMVEYTLYTMTGQAIVRSSHYTARGEAGQLDLDLSHLPGGVYVLSMETPLGVTRRNVVVGR
jgi:hypothetical protein